MSALIGKVALITGGGHGIGAAIARRLAQDGASIALTYHTTPADAVQKVVADIESTGRRALTFSADSRDPNSVIGSVEETVAKLGRIDILVNNAGVFIGKPFDAYSLEDFEHTVFVNVRAAFIAAQAAARRMQNGGKIITIGSCIANRVPGPGATLYAMSKSALIGLTKGIARDLGGRGITANLVQPGPTDVDIDFDDSQFDLQKALMALPYYGAGHDTAGLVAYLSREESRFVTGAVLTVDGGFSA
jgi:3-oxoacyl-[acyl-carrier protein] reductase